MSRRVVEVGGCARQQALLNIWVAIVIGWKQANLDCAPFVSRSAIISANLYALIGALLVLPRCSRCSQCSLAAFFGSLAAPTETALLPFPTKNGN